jgi:hypothetical protein
MGDGVDVNISLLGFNEHLKKVNAQARKALAKSLRAGINVIGNEIVRNTPQLTGELRLAAGINVQTDPNKPSGFAVFGFGKMGYLAYWLEYGHKIVGHIPKKTDTGKVVAPNPFMRVALDSKAEEASDAFASTMRSELKDVIRG